ncbi:hypothetical protein [Paraliobacillus sp. X-1268]|uniref:hypothetical protein n=1 Tax=Paraliobacillus sp. X-1268 TaxID=2213193 RepID=UPI000E3E21AB|nr:hypothetical protein [Paraliobacillus sp. X-1268]
MQKQLAFIKRLQTENGFFFPYITFIAAIVLLSVITSISLYANETKMTTLQMEQIELETLHQMAYQKFVSEQNKNSFSLDKEILQYEFPNGIVKITYDALENDAIRYKFEATTLLGNRKLSKYLIKD